MTNEELIKKLQKQNQELRDKFKNYIKIEKLTKNKAFMGLLILLILLLVLQIFSNPISNYFYPNEKYPIGIPKSVIKSINFDDTNKVITINSSSVFKDSYINIVASNLDNRNKILEERIVMDMNKFRIENNMTEEEMNKLYFSYKEEYKNSIQK